MDVVAVRGVFSWSSGIRFRVESRAEVVIPACTFSRSRETFDSLFGLVVWTDSSHTLFSFKIF